MDSLSQLMIYKRKVSKRRGIHCDYFDLEKACDLVLRTKILNYFHDIELRETSYLSRATKGKVAPDQKNDESK